MLDTAPHYIALIYIAAWFSLRIIAIAISSATKISLSSPLFTRAILVGWLFLCLYEIYTTHLASTQVINLINQNRTGVALIALALTIDLYGLLVLSTNYSLEAAIKGNHKIISSGPYRLIRHPLYLANSLGFLGMVFLVQSSLLIACYPLTVLAFIFMINKEEQLLEVYCHKEYFDYKSKVRYRLIPFIY